MTVAVATVVLAMLVIGPLFGRGEELAADLSLGSAFETFWMWFRWPTVFLILVAWGATIFHIAPNHRSPWKYELPGAALFAVASVISTGGFSIYLNRFAADGNAFFGVIGSVLSMLLWLYLLSIGLLVGAELNSIIARRAGVSESPERPEPFRRGYSRVRDLLRQRMGGKVSESTVD
jgi:membrane protein